MTFIQKCPAKNRLVDYLTGKLPASESTDYANHISDCDICEDTIRGLDVSDTFSDLAGSAFEALFAEGSQDQQIVNQLISQMRVTSPNATRGFGVEARKLEDRAAEITRLLDPPGDRDAIAHLAHYRILELIGAGSTGVVYRAIDTNLDRTVALKILRPSLGEMARERFLAEARLAASIDHSHVVTIYHVGIEGPLAFMAMQWVPGETLEDRLKQQAVMTEGQLRELGQQIASGLSAAHAKNLIHRDIKPANIWIARETGEATILDFGLARIADDDPQMTATGMLAGTPNFMSPEQTRGLELDGRSDLFSLGCLLYRAATGKLPFGSTGILATLQSIQNDFPRLPMELNPNLSTGFNTLVMRLLEKHPVNRPHSAAELQHAFEDPAAAGLEIGWTTAPQKQPPMPASRIRNGFIAAVLLIALGLGGWYFGPQIVRIMTDQGELVIQSDDKDVEIQVLNNGREVAVIDNQTQFRLDIKSGKYDLQVKGDANSFELSKDRITLKRGGREIVNITRKNQPGGDAQVAINEEQILFGGNYFSRQELKQELKRLLGVDVDLDPAKSDSLLADSLGASSESFSTIKPSAKDLKPSESNHDASSSAGIDLLPADPTATTASNLIRFGGTPQKTFKGKYYWQWKELLKKETSKEAIAEALLAVSTLTAENAKLRDDMIDQVVTPLIRKHGSMLIGSSPDERGYLVEPMIKSFRHCSSAQIINFIVNEIEHGSIQSRDTLNLFFSPTYIFDYGVGREPAGEYQQVLVHSVPRISHAILAMVAEERDGDIGKDEAMRAVQAARIFQSMMIGVRPNRYESQFMEMPKKRLFDLDSRAAVNLVNYVRLQRKREIPPMKLFDTFDMLTALMLMELEPEQKHVDYVACLATKEWVNPYCRVHLVESLVHKPISETVFRHLKTIYEENDANLNRVIQERRSLTIQRLVIDVLQSQPQFGEAIDWVAEQIALDDENKLYLETVLKLMNEAKNAIENSQPESTLDHEFGQ